MKSASKTWILPIFVTAFLLFSVAAWGITFKTIYSPFTGKLDFYAITSNTSDEILTVVEDSGYYNFSYLFGFNNLSKCAGVQILKMSGGNWVCASDAGGSGESKWIDAGTYIYPNTSFANDIAVLNATINDSIIFDSGIRARNISNNALVNDTVFAIEMRGPGGTILPHFIVTSGGDTQASYIMRSFMIVNENASFFNTNDRTDCSSYMGSIAEELKIDCNTTDTGADLIVSDDAQIVGDFWLKNTDNQWRFFSRTLTLLDELFLDILFNRVRDEINSTGGLTITDIRGETLVVNLNKTETILGAISDTITLNTGNNGTPSVNIVTYQDKDDPELFINTTTPTASHADVAVIILGSDSGNPYLADYSVSHNEQFVDHVYDAFGDIGSLYKSGLTPTVTATHLNISSGSVRIRIAVTSYTNNVNSTQDFYIINSTGNYVECSDNTCFDEYSDGTAISANRYFNVVWGVVPKSSTTMRLIAQVQDYTGSGNEYTSALAAEADDLSKTLFFPSVAQVKSAFTPVARTIHKNAATLNFETFSTGAFHQDLRGKITISGGSPPSPSITEHGDLEGLADDDHTQYILENGTRALTANWNTGGFNITMDECLANKWDNATLVMNGSSQWDANKLNTGQGANELYDMDQNVQIGDSVTFLNLTASDSMIINANDTSLGIGSGTRFTIVNNGSCGIMKMGTTELRICP